jgi:hypothetical protein
MNVVFPVSVFYKHSDELYILQMQGISWPVAKKILSYGVGYFKQTFLYYFKQMQFTVFKVDSILSVLLTLMLCLLLQTLA